MDWKGENRGREGRGKAFAFYFISLMVVAWTREVAVGVERRK